MSRDVLGEISGIFGVYPVPCISLVERFFLPTGFNQSFLAQYKCVTDGWPFCPPPLLAPHRHRCRRDPVFWGRGGSFGLPAKQKKQGRFLYSIVKGGAPCWKPMLLQEPGGECIHRKLVGRRVAHALALVVRPPQSKGYDIRVADGQRSRQI